MATKANDGGQVIPCLREAALPRIGETTSRPISMQAQAICGSNRPPIGAQWNATTIQRR
jgi:hypothetical protein